MEQPQLTNQVPVFQYVTSVRPTEYTRSLCYEPNTRHDECVYCQDCHKAWPVDPQQKLKDNLPKDMTTDVPKEATENCQGGGGGCKHGGQGMEFPGVFVSTNFVSEEEEETLVAAIDKSPWKPSQSGRVKQDYGPRVNFKRHKLKCEGFTGLPSFSEPLVTKLVSVPVLQDFKPVEQCHLEYVPDRGSSIDPHIDDTWLWGERLVTVNLLSDTYLLMTPYETKKPLHATSTSEERNNDRDGQRTRSVKIPMPRRSLIVVYGEARYNWEHSIPREAIRSRRIALTLRELTSEFQEGGPQAAIGKSILETALSFKGTVIG